MWRGTHVLRRCAATGYRAGNSTGHQRIPTRQFMRRRLEDGSKRQSLRPVEDVYGTSKGFRDLLRPFAFTVAVTGISFTGAAIWQYEGFRRLNRWQQQQRPRSGANHHGFYGKAGEFRHRLNAWWNRLYPAEKLVCGIIGANVAVFLAWRVPQFSTVMVDYFMASPMARVTCWPMLLSTFSQYGPVHLLFNMYVLWSFAPVASAQFGKEQFLATYLSAGVISSLASYAHKVARASPIPSIGASGAIMALIGIVGTLYPDSRLSFAFVNQLFPHSFSAETGVKGLIVLDTLGILMGWKFLDHAGHLGGMLFGIWFAKYGHRLSMQYRDAVVQYWHKLRGKP